jgi:hypothetical protein
MNVASLWVMRSSSRSMRRCVTVIPNTMKSPIGDLASMTQPARPWVRLDLGVVEVVEDP